MGEVKPKLEKQVDRLREPFFEFMGAQSTASALLLCAAIGGMVVSAAFYLATNAGGAEEVASG